MVRTNGTTAHKIKEIIDKSGRAPAFGEDEARRDGNLVVI
jgi:hypothetical protein